jgi:hypothetical protein
MTGLQFRRPLSKVKPPFRSANLTLLDSSLRRCIRSVQVPPASTAKPFSTTCLLCDKRN